MGRALELAIVCDVHTPCTQAEVWLLLQLSGTHTASCRAIRMCRSQFDRIGHSATFSCQTGAGQTITLKGKSARACTWHGSADSASKGRHIPSQHDKTYSGCADPLAASQTDARSREAVNLIRHHSARDRSLSACPSLGPVWRMHCAFEEQDDLLVPCRQPAWVLSDDVDGAITGLLASAKEE